MSYGRNDEQIVKEFRSVACHAVNARLNHVDARRKPHARVGAPVAEETKQRGVYREVGRGRSA